MTEENTKKENCIDTCKDTLSACFTFIAILLYVAILIAPFIYAMIRFDVAMDNAKTLSCTNHTYISKAFKNDDVFVTINKKNNFCDEYPCTHYVDISACHINKKDTCQMIRERTYGNYNSFFKKLNGDVLDVMFIDDEMKGKEIECDDVGNCVETNTVCTKLYLFQPTMDEYYHGDVFIICMLWMITVVFVTYGMYECVSSCRRERHDDYVRI